MDETHDKIIRDAQGDPVRGLYDYLQEFNQKMYNYSQKYTSAQEVWLYRSESISRVHWAILIIFDRLHGPGSQTWAPSRNSTSTKGPW